MTTYHVAARLLTGAAAIVTLLFISTAHATEGGELFSRFGSADQVELGCTAQGPWQAVRPGEAFGPYTVLSVPKKAAGCAYAVLETEDDNCGQIVYVDDKGIRFRIEKAFGRVGEQPVTSYPSKPPGYWKRVFQAQDDILGKEYLSDPRDPSYERTKGQLPPLLFADTYVGMKEHPYEVHVAWDGSVGVNYGFFFGMPETRVPDDCPVLPFAINGREIQREESHQVLHTLLNEHLPATHYVYQRDAEKVGWEQIVFMGTAHGKPALFVRFRLVNYSSQPKPMEFAIHAPSGGSLETPQKDSLTVTVPYPAGQASSVPIVCDRPFVFRENVPTWQFEIPSGGHEDLYLVLPGYSMSGPVGLEPGEVRDVFFQSLLGQYKTWEEFFSRGVQYTIPERKIDEVYKASLAKVMVCVDGDDVRGGAVHYEGFWAYCTVYTCQVLLENGHFDDARRYLDRFLSTEIDDTGRFRMGAYYQIFDAGDFLQLLADYWWYTGDASLITENLDPIQRVISYVKGIRQESMDELAPDDPRYGLIEGIMNNDWATDGTSYFYTNDAPVWEGFREFAKALQGIGAAKKDRELIGQGDELAQYAEQYYQDLRRSFETAIERDGDEITYIHIRPVPEGAREQMRHESQHNKRFRAHRRFHEWPRFMGTDFLTDRERSFFFDYEFEHEQTVLGVRRYVPRNLDDFQIYNAAYQKLRMGRIRHFLMEYYGFIDFMMSPGTWTGFEQTQLLPRGEEKGRRTGHGVYDESTRMCGFEGAHATWPVARLTRQIFAFDEPGGEVVWVGRGIPRHWLRPGQPVEAKGIPTRYGKLDLSFVYNAKDRTLNVRVDPLQGRTVPKLLIGARDPENGRAVAVTSQPSGKECHLDVQRELVSVTNVSEPISLVIQFE